ncbi:hypothetical protein GCM10022422_14380 [Flavobacterium ginsengisoli]|uniref:TIR domain-containing protein n=1 Tax=Flavobacterium ginsengisoli TaxID=871694 RepID=A0ABP7FAA1_9FLAO|nr:toll/interleukin-1 receptor domain-containing protein [Flavobacterium ginsengisoli]
MKKKQDIFISHSGKDRQIVDDFIDLILQNALNVTVDRIFCSSTDGTKIKSGTDWRDSILKALQEAKINFLFISPNYKESEVCMNEMGAAWVTSAKVIPLIIEPINYKTVGVIQQPIQIEKLLDEKSLDRIRDILQESLEIPNNLIKSDRWTAKKKEFILKTKAYLKNNPFNKPLDREEFEELILEKNDLETTLTNLIEEKIKLENLIEDLKKAKDKSEVKEIVKQYSDTSEFDDFEELTQKVCDALTSFHPIIRGIIFKTYSNKEKITINAQAYSDYVDEALANDYINEELEADFSQTTKMAKIESLLDKLSIYMEKDLSSEFYEKYEEEYNAPLKISNKLFWEEVLDLNLFFS